jgi:Tfp pilus assembly ATPase PilU
MREMPIWRWFPDTSSANPMLHDRQATRQPLRLPPNFRDVTADKVGTVIGIIGATGAGRGTKVPDAVT